VLLFGSLVGSFVMLIGVAGLQSTTIVAEGCDHAKIQGTWRIVSVESGGKSDNRDNEKYTITFNDSTMTFRDCEDGDQAAVKFQLHKGQSEKHIRFGSVRGIYDFKDGHLLICYSLDGDRPTRFTTTSDRQEEVLMILERIEQPRSAATR
jgi:uncharacterized protein (TIGR03067 family)